MTKRDALLRDLSAQQFAAWETGLFLDTHPTCKQALEAHAEYVKNAERRDGKDHHLPIRRSLGRGRRRHALSCQRFTAPYGELKAALTDIGTEELSHLEMVGSIVYRLTKGLSEEELKKQGFSDYFVEHTLGVYPQDPAGYPFNAATFNSKGDLFADLFEDLAAEQKARVTYDNILRLVDDPDVRDPIKFLREREIVHYQRFSECVRIAQEKLNAKNFYAFNPEFDKRRVK